MSGQVVRKLVDGQRLPGSYSCEWNGLNSQGAEVNSGIYLYRITTSDYQETRKMILMK
jgi:flagellar hook assembly protein FlgD